MAPTSTHLGIGDEHEAGPGLGHLGNGHSLLLGHEAQHAEDGEARVQAGQAVGGRDENAVTDEVVVVVVVRAHGRHAAQRDRVRKEDLRPGVDPHLAEAK